MHALVIDVRTAKTLKSYKYPDDKPMVCRDVAEEYCKTDLSGELEIEDFWDGVVPEWAGDIRVEFRDDPDNSAVIWKGESFYYKGGE